MALTTLILGWLRPVYRPFIFVMVTLWTYGTMLQFLPESRVLSQTLLRVKAILRSSYREPRNDLVPRIFPSQKKMCVSDCGPIAQALNIHPRIQSAHFLFNLYVYLKASLLFVQIQIPHSAGLNMNVERSSGPIPGARKLGYSNNWFQKF
ncbi:hypothetical protein EV421DRAFT_1742368 [Armillaria borealis]|uniref:Uncharacterized protein n=1 Tax=Armillaria borealis TaxID=47425 RepID=A0AA39J095_9AGAR|nr:hypothetical protein EV421DRAFT_1742368 [Armillaria borealis]